MPDSNNLNILLLGDVVGKPGRKALEKSLVSIIKECDAGFVMVNGENASGGLGITPPVAEELLLLPINVLTSGNHIWKHKEIRAYLDDQPRLLRPANYPQLSPGSGSGIFESACGIKVGVLNLEGLLFMTALACPFRTADQEIDRLRKQTNVILVDFHAEATSEKRALGHYLDGRASVVVGTHTHIPTADVEVLSNGTGYLTDLGMCGPTDSVIGIRKELAIGRFTTKLPHPFQVASGKVQIQGAIATVDTETGRCCGISQRSWPVDT